MPPTSMMIKPASSACNLRCKYCFYRFIADSRKIANKGKISEEILEQIVRKGLEHADGVCVFAFQGGEPMLAGLPFYRCFIGLQNRYNCKGVTIRNTIQTNGTLINDEWASFFFDNQFLVGVSLDGPKKIHDFNRIDSGGGGSFIQVMNAIDKLKNNDVDYNILSVVTGKNARLIERTYGFFKKQGFSYLQFIPVLEPIEQERGMKEYYLSIEDYEMYLINIFDLWYSDLKTDKYISIRHIDNWISILLGRSPESCNMKGKCSVQYVIEGDGSVYPCDFYAFDHWKIADIMESDLKEIAKTKRAKCFIEESLVIPEQCKKCKYVALCRNGCKRDRTMQSDGTYTKNYYCKAICGFFCKREHQLINAANLCRDLLRKPI